MSAHERLFVDPVAYFGGKVKEPEWSRLTHRPDARWKNEFERWWRGVVVSAIIGAIIELCIEHDNIRHRCVNWAESLSVESKHEHDAVSGASNTNYSESGGWKVCG